MSVDQLEFSTFCIGNVAEALKISELDAYVMLLTSGLLKDYIVVSELCSKYGIHPNQINQWKKHLKEHGADVFKTSAQGSDDKDRLIEQLYKTIGELTMDVEFIKKKLLP